MNLAVAALMAALAFASVDLPEPEQAPYPPVVEVHLEDAVTPVTARWVLRALERAEAERAACLVVVLDTPGGLLDSTRVLVRGLLAARVPVVVFVPPGGRAASAGTFIALAAHVIAMGPGSNIGAAHPVQIGGLPIGPPQPAGPESPDAQPPVRETSGSPLEEKAVEDTAAWARALAANRGRDPAWAERTVTESRSSSVEEALAAGIVDVVVSDVEQLLLEIDGREVALGARRVTLMTADVPVILLEPWWGERVLAVISRPNIAFLLLIFGVYGILFEFYSPGWGVAGTLGAVALVLGFFAMAVLPINYVGLLLVALALGMFVAEAFVPSFGALTLGGVVCLTLGGLMLVDTPAGFMRLSLEVVLPVAAATALIVAFLVGGVVRTHRRHALTGADALIGARATADEDFVRVGVDWTGRVRMHGEYWNARAEVPVREAEPLEVQRSDGLTLIVAEAEPETGRSLGAASTP